MILFLTAVAALCLPLSLLCIVCYGFKTFRPSRPNRNLAKLMGVMKKHDVTNKKTIQKNNSLL